MNKCSTQGKHIISASFDLKNNCFMGEIKFTDLCAYRMRHFADLFLKDI